MLQSKRILIVEDNRLFAEAVGEFFAHKNTFTVVGIAQNSLQAADMLNSTNPDLILLDLVMPQSDGFVLLEHLYRLHDAPKPKVIVLSSLNHEAVIQRACALGACYYMAKPLRLQDVHARCLDVLRFEDSSASKRASKPSQRGHKAENYHSILVNSGIPSHSKGFQYLAEAIDMVLREPELIFSLTKRLYPSLGERHQASANAVERSIRNAIDTAWRNGRLENINRIFNSVIVTANYKPTNGEFISLIVKRLQQ
jgi:two-component system response regulator (stage 0 sporulation protein A)